MPEFKFVLPKMGESVAEATIIKWLKQPGDQIREDEVLVEIATDKVDSDVPSPVTGKILELLAEENDVAQIGDVIAIIQTEEAESEATFSETVVTPTPPILVKEEQESQQLPIDIPAIPQVEEKARINPPLAEQESSSRFYSPLVKSIAAEEGLSNQDLDAIAGTGAEGRVTKQDLLDFIQQRSPTNPTEEVKSHQESEKEPVRMVPNSEPKIPSTPTFAVSGNDEIVEMDRMRKLIAEHMVMSVQTAPHVTSFVESDVTSLVKWREKNKAAFEKKIGEKITYTPIFIQAVAKAIRDFPMINITLNGTQITKKTDINIGLAAALPTGNLIVPVIKKADQLNLVGLTKAVNDLANRSKTNKLLPDEVKDGTFTITNIGSFGNIMGTPIINQPQVAILAIGAIQKKPAVIETEYGDMVGIRHKMYLSLSYDHRIVDGALGGMFLKRISDYLEAWDINAEI
ncbi:MAG: 2-oxo acid dehydrogenase subunit E2 [Pyrinomonadaceae bacterium]|nr:2-oxo acid dehydrogenase subunit E2 [Sphingobacteriaceae bacterium]